MSSVEHIVRKVADESLGEMQTDLSSGKIAATEAIDKRLNEATAEVQRISDQEERQADALRRQIIGTAELSARNMSLEVVEDYLNEAFSQAIVKLQKYTTTSGYPEVLRQMIIEAIDQIGGDDFVVQGNAKDQKAIANAFEQVTRNRKVRLVLDSQPLARSAGGVVVRSADGYVTFDNSFEARLDRLKPTLRKQIAQMFTEQQH